MTCERGYPMIRKWTTLFLTALFVFTISVATGCNTVEGMGEDLQEASHETEEAIEE